MNSLTFLARLLQALTRVVICRRSGSIVERLVILRALLHLLMAFRHILLGDLIGVGKLVEAVRPQLFEQISFLLHRCLLKVQLVDVPIVHAGDDGVESAVHAVHPRDEVFHLDCQFFVFIVVLRESFEDLALIPIFKFIPILLFI